MLATLSGQLGFEDLASFNRAFRHWTGSTPGSYRRGLGG
ncbi:helix-turn-helix domain-containing protein [Marinospirillum sp.]